MAGHDEVCRGGTRDKKEAVVGEGGRGVVYRS